MLKRRPSHSDDGITKRGSQHLRTLFVHGARAVVRAEVRKPDSRSMWVNELRQWRGYNRATVAVANRNARERLVADLSLDRHYPAPPRMSQSRWRTPFLGTTPQVIWLATTARFSAQPIPIAFVRWGSEITHRSALTWQNGHIERLIGSIRRESLVPCDPPRTLPARRHTTNQSTTAVF